ncbi:uncharacterized protein PV09_00108 [Verruconis gallopava]|uniref:POPLD-domain-containing protein n=1 Tax=Verruconis gallopava TaxID=253628 RepID=A0A0D1Z878_9PEZI|nr:uncharacterized protein PV09_00108 [Verruconis gallopava]KIW09177.1 hypothetical protein PV09_00108 [Verruconis gallopava]
MAHPNQGKRKDGPALGNQGRNHKRTKLWDARSIRSQTSDAAFSNGELNVDKFIKAREFEIKALENGIKKAKHGLSTRAHQELPKELRRRTASHNVKRLPKRLRERAKKEMIEDNTPTVTSRRRKPSGHKRLRLEIVERLQALSEKSKERRRVKKAVKAKSQPTAEVPSETGQVVTATQESVKVKSPKVKKSRLREPALPPARFRKRQINKTWLPTHMWHAKRAKMTPPREPMWRFAIPLTPSIKSYRNTHRASADKGAIAWDTSYMSTIGLEGREESIAGLLKALGVGAKSSEFDPWGVSGAKWRAGTRVWEGWLHERDAPATLIAPAAVLWNSNQLESEAGVQPQNKPGKRKLFIRIHPAAFFQLWEQVVRLAKVQKPSLAVEDLRFEIGSIEITGPNASEALVAVLRPLEQTCGDAIWPKLAATTPASLPRNCLLAISITDPRLHHPPRTIAIDQLNAQDPKLIQLLTSWPLDRTPCAAAIFDRNARAKATRSMPSNSAVNRRKSMADPGEYPAILPSDPLIPVLAFATQSSPEESGTWTVLLPWRYVLPVWKSLVCYPLSTGGAIRFGGINEKRQLAYENGIPWFPADFPATKAGQQWEAEDSHRRKTEWDRKPKSRRIEFRSINLGENRRGEIGVGWSCDWQRLIDGPPVAEENRMNTSLEDEGISEDLEKTAKALTALHQIPQAIASQALTRGRISNLEPNGLATVRITMLSRGRPNICARIYRLPTNNPNLRQKWLEQQPPLRKKQPHSRNAKFPSRPSENASSAMQRSWLAAAILADPPEPGSKDYPVVPDEIDLVGFVTTGNFNLNVGKGVGIGSVLLRKVLTSEQCGALKDTDLHPPSHEQFLCIVRDAGESYGRLAKWKLV